MATRNPRELPALAQVTVLSGVTLASTVVAYPLLAGYGFVEHALPNHYQIGLDNMYDLPLYGIELAALVGVFVALTGGIGAARDNARAA